MSLLRGRDSCTKLSEIFLLQLFTFFDTFDEPARELPGFIFCGARFADKVLGSGYPLLCPVFILARKSLFSVL